MTSEKFNIKYKDFLEKGHYGLVIDIPDVVDYLDVIFQGLINIPEFSYSQIKLKFNSSRVYLHPNVIDTSSIEKRINEIVKEFDKKNRNINS